MKFSLVSALSGADTRKKDPSAAVLRENYFVEISSP